MARRCSSCRSRLPRSRPRSMRRRRAAPRNGLKRTASTSLPTARRSRPSESARSRTRPELPTAGRLGSGSYAAMLRPTFRSWCRSQRLHLVTTNVRSGAVPLISMIAVLGAIPSPRSSRERGHPVHAEEQAGGRPCRDKSATIDADPWPDRYAVMAHSMEAHPSRDARGNGRRRNQRMYLQLGT